MPGHRRFSSLQPRHLCRPAALAAALGALALVTANPARAGDEHFKARDAISLPNGQKVLSFDIGYDDPVVGGYFLADRTNAAIDGIDVTTNQVTEELTANFAGNGKSPNVSGPNGILTVGHRYMWAGDYGNGSNGGTGGLVKVIDLNNGNLVATISTGGTARADELCYDSKDHVIMIANDAEPLPPTGNGPYLTFISTSGSNQYKILGQLFLGGQNGAPKATNGIEQCQWVKKNDSFYVNIPEVNGPGDDSAAGAVLQIDPVAMTITNNFSIPHNQCEGPQGMALGPQGQILLGCNDPLKDVPQSVVINLKGKVVATFPGEDGPDEVWYNRGDGHYFLGESGGANPQHLGVIDALTGNEDSSPVTGLAGKGGAHSVAADAFTNKVFVPIPSTAGAGACSSVGGDDSDGCILVYKATRSRNEAEGE